MVRSCRCAQTSTEPLMNSAVMQFFKATKSSCIEQHQFTVFTEIHCLVQLPIFGEYLLNNHLLISNIYVLTGVRK